MEEMKETAGADAADATSGEGKKKFSLPPISKRTLILGGAGLLVLALAVAGGLAYRASAQKAKAAAEAAAVLKKEKAAREAAEQAEMVQRGEEARRSHQEILEASNHSPARTETAGGVTVSDPVVAPDKADAKADAKADMQDKPVAPATSATGAKKPENAEVRPPAVAAPGKAGSDAAVPDATGGCTLSGKSAEDYGKALGRCLEEYNRLEGRPPRR